MCFLNEKRKLFVKIKNDQQFMNQCAHKNCFCFLRTHAKLKENKAQLFAFESKPQKDGKQHRIEQQTKSNTQIARFDGFFSSRFS
jgi:hypothetical protein